MRGSPVPTRRGDQRQQWQGDRRKPQRVRCRSSKEGVGLSVFGVAILQPVLVLAVVRVTLIAAVGGFVVAEIKQSARLRGIVWRGTMWSESAEHGDVAGRQFQYHALLEINQLQRQFVIHA